MTPDEVYQRHKPIRNKIRQFEPRHLIGMAVDILRDRIDPRPVSKWDYLPWTLLLIIRWTFQYTEPGRNLKAPTERDLRDLYRSIYDLDPGIAMDGEDGSDTLRAMLTRTLFAQLPFQAHTYELRSIGRQILMFEDLGARFGFSEKFKERYGLSIHDFFGLYYAAWAVKPPRFSTRTFHGAYDDTTIKAFFDVLSVDLESGKQFIRDYTRTDAPIQFQYHEHSPLELKPFFCLGEQWTPFCYKLMESALQNNIYDLMKRDIPDFLAQMFGPVFEQYVGGTVSYYSDGAHETEDSLRKRLPKGAKVTDFMIDDGDSAVFIEAKGTELHGRARVYQSKKSILTNPRSTILKAAQQCQETAYRLSQTDFLIGKTLYAIVVTYKEYLLGDGQGFWDDVIGDYIGEKLIEAGATVTIPPGNIIYTSIADFDWLMAGAKQRGTTVSAVLAEIIERNQSFDTRTFMVRQHLEKLWKIHYEPPGLEAARTNFQDEMVSRFKSLVK